MERPTASAVAPTTLADHLAALRRRRVPSLITAAAIVVLAAGGALLWPASYRSTGTILIEQQEVPLDLVRSMVSSYADQRIQVISQRVMTTDNLMRIIERYGLYKKELRTEPREAVLESMRKDIKFAMISADVVDPRLGRPTKATIAFSVSYDSRSAQLAAKVASELSSLYLRENLETRKQMADDATVFLTTQAERLSKQIAELESTLAGFKEQNLHRLPELAGLNLQLMTRAEEELRETETRLRSLDQQVVFLDAQLAQLEPASQVYTQTGQRVMSPSDRVKVLRSDLARATAVYAPDHPDVVRMTRELQGLEREAGSVDSANDLTRQLRDAQGQLAQARERYAPDHPDIQQLQRLVDSIEASMATAPLTAAAVKEQPDNPAYIQVSAQREASVSERAALEGKRTKLRAKLEELEGRLAQAPQIEREYSALVRDMEGAQVKYREVRQKQMEATLAKNLETERKGERFTLIEPPFVPQEPVSPNRLAIMLLGAIVALGAGVGMIALLEALDTTVRSRRDLDVLLPIAPLAVLPWIDTPAELATRARVRRWSGAGAVAGVAAAVVATHFLYRPLDVLWEVALRRLLG